jgi:peptidoglycan/LPS O-acetylase OafA/YrhL
MHIETQSLPDQAAVAQGETPATVGLPKGQRIAALDFTKGALVVIMVLYHWINYFIGLQWPYYRYLRFLTPSFIFISGFMISHVYLSKYAPADPQLSRRLVTRGLKLLAIFLVLNLARDVIMPVLGTGAAIQNIISPQILIAFFMFGSLPAEGPKLVSFSILVPISYLLIVSGALMPLYRRYKYTFHVVCFSLLLVSLIVGYIYARNYNVEFVAIGMLGVLIGFTPIRKIDTFGRHPYLLALAYLGYVVAIAVWDAQFLLLIVAVLPNLCILYLIGARGIKASAVKNEVILLGKYSLLGYISQVAILQFLSKGYQRIELGVIRLPSSFLAAMLLTILAVEFVDRARARSRGADRLYKAIFA